MTKTKQARSTKKTGAANRASNNAEKTPVEEKTEMSHDFPIVGIGASAGGLEALERFFKAMPVDAGIGFVLVVHLDPTHISILPELLQKHTRMPVCHVEDGMLVKRDHVYVIPPDKDLTILHGTLHLMRLVRPRGARLPIDSFFRSLAQDQGRNGVCIILSGTGTDGTLGVKAIKGEVGMVMVQDEESAKYEGMPRSALDTGLVDYVLPPDKMPEQLIKYTAHATQKGALRIAPAEGPIPQALQKIFVILRARIGHDFSLYKKNTICRRIERRMNVHQIDDISDYVRYLQKSDREADVLFKELLIGVTNFFRDPEAFQILETKILPKLLAGKPDGYAVRVWIPACASGEEAYSVAMVLHECTEQIGRNFHIQIFGTDIDEDAIAVARAGRYPESIAVDVGPERIKRHFIKEEDGQYRVKKPIRAMLVFAPQNVIKDPPFTNLDLLCCRNLLIYLGTELQRKLLPIFHYSLKRDGILFLGSSETISPTTDLFSILHRKWKIFRRKSSAVPAHPVFDFPTHAESGEARDLAVPETVQRAEELSALRLVETILQQSGAPPCAIINDACNTLYIHGRTGRFLELAEGKARVNIVEMARPGLRKELAAAIRQVAIHKQETFYEGLQVDYNGGKLFLNLTVQPILEQIAMRGLMMVVFEETATPTKEDKRRPKPAAVEHEVKSVEELEQELQYAKASLQATIEELETANEELKSTNEELQSTNEELQSTNEELETSKEELQSLNEESATVNAELQSRIDELSKTNDDMKNLLDSTNIATIFLDTDLRVRRFTPRATEIIPLRATDAGRPIKHLACKLIDTDLAGYGEQVLTDLAVRETEVESKDDRSYVMRVRPYRTTGNVIDGVVITFEDTTKRKRAEEGRIRSLATVEQERDKLRTLIDSVADEVWFCDAEGNLALANRAALGGLGFERMEEVTQPVSEWLPKLEILAPDGRPRAGEAAPLLRSLRGEVLKEVEELVRHPRTGEMLHRRVSSTPLRDSSGQIIGAVAVVHDITEAKRAERALRESEQRYRMLFELASDSIVLIDAETAAIVDFNRRAYEHLGYTREEFAKLAIRDIEAAESASDVTKHIKKIINEGSDVFETKHKTKDGEIYDVRVKAKSISIGKKTFLLTTWHDIKPADAGG